MAQPQVDPISSTPSAARDERAGPGYAAPLAERPVRQVTPYSQAAAPPAASLPAQQAPQGDEDEDEANSYDSDEASK